MLNKIVGGKLKPVIDSFGLQINKIMDQYGRYKYTILSDYKITLAKILSTIPNKYKKSFRSFFIPIELYDWMHSDKFITKYIKYGLLEGDYIKTRNSDTMNRQNNGVIALLLD